MKQFRPDLPSSTAFTLQTLDGGRNPQGNNEAGVEAVSPPWTSVIISLSHDASQNLDIQYTIGIASGVPTTFISVGENFQDGDLEGFLDIINFLNNESSPPQVLTTSYGDDEPDVSKSLTKYVSFNSVTAPPFLI